eukprot:scaffold27324_cov63-Cyclotella_meneghiniana.AAC.7
MEQYLCWSSWSGQRGHGRDGCDGGGGGGGDETTAEGFIQLGVELFEGVGGSDTHDDRLDCVDDDAVVACLYGSALHGDDR